MSLSEAVLQQPQACPGPRGGAAMQWREVDGIASWNIRNIIPDGGPRVTFSQITVPAIAVAGELTELSRSRVDCTPFLG